MYNGSIFLHQYQRQRIFNRLLPLSFYVSPFCIVIIWISFYQINFDLLLLRPLCCDFIVFIGNLLSSTRWTCSYTILVSFWCNLKAILSHLFLFNFPPNLVPSWKFCLISKNPFYLNLISLYFFFFHCYDLLHM